MLFCKHCMRDIEDLFQGMEICPPCHFALYTAVFVPERPARTTGQLVTPSGPVWLVKRVTVLGRHAADVTLEDPDVSRSHATIERHRVDQFIVRDMDSTNGTFVNERRVSSHELTDGDVLRLGKTDLLFNRWPMAGLPQALGGRSSR